MFARSAEKNPSKRIGTPRNRNTEKRRKSGGKMERIMKMEFSSDRVDSSPAFNSSPFVAGEFEKINSEKSDSQGTFGKKV